ncbi:MAG: hypothetical protein GXZ10_03020 [Gammaproteobacteria bacterium]|nr:hypothetical protein [Gammaproteobacteria bacterium]
MKKISLIPFTLLALSIHATAQAQEHRLAFSQAQQVEVFVDQADGANWCKDELALRFAFSLEHANLTAVESLLPKLGVLFSQQCPAAEKVTWQALNKDKKIQASGTANKQTAWMMNQDPTESASQIAAAPVAAQAAEVAAPVTQTQTPAVQAAAEAPAKTEQAATVEPSVAAEAPAPVSDASQPSTQSEAAVAATATPPAAVEAPATQSAAIEKNTEVEPVKAEAAAPTPVVEAKPAAVELYSVNGWQPKESHEFLVNNKAFRVLSDQQGCKAFLQADADLGLQEFTVNSTGVTCENGLLNGKGRIVITRSDGARIAELDGFFKHGVPLDQEVDLPIVDVDEKGQVYLLLGKDVANKNYYLLRAQKNYRGYWSINSGTVYLLTDAKDTFRQAESIKTAVLFPVAAIAKNFSRNSSYTLAAVTDFTDGIVNRNGESWLYEVGVRKPQRNSPEWTFNPNNATNYLFRNEARAAREAQQQAEREAREAQRLAERKAYEERLELERIARQASRELSTYENYQENYRDLPDLVASKLTNVSYSKVGYSGYQSALKGREAEFSQIVKISGEKKDLFWADYPYNLAVDVLGTDVDLSKGWYLIRGKQKIDAELKDDQGLPLTIVYPTYTFACKENGCTDFFTPLNLTRLEFGKPDWTPEIAEQQIADAQKVQ